MKTIYKILSFVLGACLLCACFVGCNSSSSNAEELSYIGMRINPEIELVIDKEEKVVAVNAINEDGETVLCELELIGMTVEEAGEAFTAMATELGFIDVNTEEATVFIWADGKNAEDIDEIEEKIAKKINGFFDKKGIFGKVSSEELETYEELAAEWGVSLKEAKLINRIVELYPEMTIEEILAMSFKERIALIKDDSDKNGLTANLREEYKKAVEAIKTEFSEFFALREEIKELELRLKDETLTEEEISLIQQEVEAKKAEYEALKAEYETAISALKAEKREKVAETKNDIKEKAQQRRKDFENILKEHEEKLSEQKEIIEEQINQWRENIAN